MRLDSAFSDCTVIELSDYQTVRLHCHQAGCSVGNSPNQARLHDLRVAPAHPDHQPDDDQFYDIEDEVLVVVTARISVEKMCERQESNL